MGSIAAIVIFGIGIRWLTQDRDGLNFRARDYHRASTDRDRKVRPEGKRVP